MLQCRCTVAHMTTYTYGDTIEQHRMVAYRKYLMNRKRKVNVDNVSQGRGIMKRCNRALIYYREYVESYLASKRAYLEQGGKAA